MVSAGAANKKAFGIDRTTNPWSDMVGTEVIWVAGSNVAECSPITTNYIWQAREQGAKIIVQDPRITPAARTCDLVPAGEAGARRGALRRRAADHDRARLARSRVHRRAHGRLRAGRGILPAVDAAADRGGDRRAAARADAGRRVVGHREDELPLPRPRHRAPLERRAERPRHDQPRARVGTDRQAEERLRHDRRPGQRSGRSRARAEVRSASGLARHQQPGAPAIHRRRLGHRRAGAARSGRRRLRAVPQDRSRRDQGPAVDLLQSEGVAAGQRVRHALPREAGVLRRHRLLPQRHRLACRRRAARQPARGGRRDGDAGRGPHHQDQQGRGLPGRGARGLAHHPGHRAGARPAARLHVQPTRARSSRSCASPARAAWRTTPA